MSDEPASEEPAKAEVTEEEEEEGEQAPPIPVSHRRFRITQRYSYGPITLREYDTICCDGACVLEGFNKGLASLLTVSYILDKLKLPLVGDIVSAGFQAYSRVEDGLPVHGCRIYGNRDLVCFVSEYDFKSPELQSCLVQAIFDFSRRHRSPMVISVDGVKDDPSVAKKKQISVEMGPPPGRGGGRGRGGAAGLDIPPELLKKPGGPTREDIFKLISARYEGKIWFITNDEGVGAQLKGLGHAPVREMAITGISGGIVSEGAFEDVPVVSLFGSMSAMVPIVTKTAILLTQTVDVLLGEAVVIDTSDLSETDDMVVAKIKELTKMASSPVAAKAPEAWQSMYM